MEVLMAWTTSIFFQAEDGIRDIGVTGVQTCALPISGAQGARQLADRALQLVALGGERARGDAQVLDEADELALVAVQRGGDLRSEERRVGEECRSRWSPHH